MSIISMSKILDALKYYKDKGYVMIDVPQCVDFDVSQHTKPEGLPELFHRGMKVYVASAEQSFLQLLKEGKLPNGKYMAVTPCYRHEPYLDDTHYSMFLKLELIVVGSDDVSNVVEDSFNFLSEYMECNVVTTNEGVDTKDIITLQGDELGSYGVRKTLDNTPYVYGSGIAEPRLSMCMQKQIGEL